MPALSHAPGWAVEHPNEIERLEKYERWTSETEWEPPWREPAVEGCLPAAVSSRVVIAQPQR
jgi:hypothetical protein